MMTFFVLLFVTSILSCSGQTYNYYVSSAHGSDSNGKGTQSSPWQTIGKAQNQVKSVISSLNKNSFNENITINIDDSSYYVGIDEIDVSGSLSGFKNNVWIIYQSSTSNESPLIYGGNMVTSQWTKVTTINGINLYKTNLNSQKNDIPANGQILELFMNDMRMNISKSKLLTYTHLDTTNKVIETDSKMIPNVADIMSTNYSGNLMVLVYEHWTSSYHIVNKINYDQSNGKINITLKTAPPQWVNDAPSGMRFYLLNNYQLLSMENQFYFNRTSLDLFVLISSVSNNDQVIIPNDIEILSLKGTSSTSKVERIMFKNLNFKYSAPDFSSCLSGTCMAQSVAFLETATIHTTDSNQIIFDMVNVSHTGGYAVWLDHGSTNIVYQNSYIHGLGAGGIRIGDNEGGNVAQDMLAINVTVSNNYILNGGHIFEAGCGILAQSFAYSNIVNNEIAHFKYTGISTGWTWDYETTSVSNNKIERNMIYDIGQYILSDMGCIYTLGQQPNCLYYNNICHDVYSYNYGGFGTYTDQASRWLTWQNNIIYKTKSAGHHQHFGLDNIFVNNIYAYSELGEPGDGGVRSSQHPGTCNYSSNQGACSSFTMITNIIYLNNTYNMDILGDTAHTYWRNMTTDGNTYWSTKQKTDITFPDNYTIKQWNKEGKDVQYAIANPMFVDPENYNFNLQLGSPAIALGFHQIDAENVGPNW